MPRVDVIYFRDCPHVDAARANLARAFAMVGLPPSWDEHDLGSPGLPADLRHYGSPTILVDGRDVVQEEQADSISCRVYSGDGVPSVACIARAIRYASDTAKPGG
jgi:mercuric ion transport protein